jgi:hypothetical protein
VTTKKQLLSALAGVAMLALPVTALAGHHHDGDDNPRPFAWHDQGWHRGWAKHHGYEARPVWADDDEHCHFRPRDRGPAVLCDGDGDDCRPAYGRDEDDDDYGFPLSYYQAEPPAGYGFAQKRQWLLQRRQRAIYMMQRMRARHDTRAASRMAGVVRSLDARLARRGAIGYPAPYYNTAYDPNYGTYPNYQAGPGMNALGSLVGPLLGSPSH